LCDFFKSTSGHTAPISFFTAKNEDKNIRTGNFLLKSFPAKNSLSSFPHRNLKTSMLAQVLQIFLGKEHLLRNWLISTLDKVIYFEGTNFLLSTKPLFTTLNRLETN
jgi:hypothetical protein